MGPLDPSNPNFPVYVALMEGKDSSSIPKTSRAGFGLILAMVVATLAFGVVLVLVII
jgi:hypothetical protein